MAEQSTVYKATAVGNSVPGSEPCYISLHLAATRCRSLAHEYHLGQEVCAREGTVGLLVFTDKERAVRWSEHASRMRHIILLECVTTDTPKPVRLLCPAHSLDAWTMYGAWIAGGEWGYMDLAPLGTYAVRSLTAVKVVSAYYDLCPVPDPVGQV